MINFYALVSDDSREITTVLFMTTFSGGEEGKDICIGDGGSPLMCSFPSNADHYFLAGIVLGQIACGEKEIPGLFADITQYRQWISGKTKALGIADDTFVFSQLFDEEPGAGNEWEEHWL